jgi:tRNA-splicing ligase RtcB
MKIRKIDDNMWEIPQEGGMQVPVRICSNESLLESMKGDKTLEQAQNVAQLPGIVDASFVMPDGHQGYGFPIGGVAAFSATDGIISPGGVGYDINCGVRLLLSSLQKDEVVERRDALLDELFKNVPSGLGSKGKIPRLSSSEMDAMLERGAEWACEHDYGESKDIKRLEDGGRMPADPELVSPTAKKRGSTQLGSLGSGNHFLELQYVDKVYDERIARAFGIYEGQAALMIHTGSRGCGHQVCSDYLRVMDKATKKYHINIPDRELTCAPVQSAEGQSYIKAMGCAANFAWANRQMITHWCRESFQDVYGDEELDILYDVAHNIAKLEEHKGGRYYVHRKGATRALWKGRKELPSCYRDVGQPVILPGSMGTASYVLCGTERSAFTFGSTAHGAGRLLSRSKATKNYRGETIRDELAKRNIAIRAASMKTVAEEAPGAYKDIDSVADVSDALGIGKKVARLLPLGVVKG